MNKRVIVLSAIMLLGFFVAAAQAEKIPSSKAGAAIGTNPLVLDVRSAGVDDPAPMEELGSWTDVVSTQIQIAQDKELAFDVALQCGLFTDTLVKSKGGTRDTSNATATIDVRVMLQRLNNDGSPDGDAFMAYPGVVTYAKRSQTMMAKFQGIFQECLVWAEDGSCAEYTESCLITTGEDTDGDLIPDTYTTNLDFECLQYEEVQLVLDTINANAFNFVSENLQQGEYLVTVQAQATTDTATQNGEAEAKGLIGLGSMVVDEVRFIK